MTSEQKRLPIIYVFCNNKGCNGSGDWHNMLALAEDGTGLAGHVCSSHGWAYHDMGINEDGWKRDMYAKHYPQGFVVEWVDDPDTNEGLQAVLTLACHKLKVAAEKNQ
jgi:hypothetical protein